MTNPDLEPAELLANLGRLPTASAAEALRALGDPEAILLRLADEASRLTMVDAGRATEAARTVIELAAQCGQPLPRCRALRAQARAFAYAGRFAEALDACASAAALAEETGRHDEAGRARLAAMHALTELGRLDEAVSAGESARSIFVAIGEPALAGRADINLGVVYQRRDDPAAAVRCFQRARPLVAGDPSTLGHLDNNRGEALLALNDFDAAEAAFAAALEAFEALGANHHAAVVESNMADLAVRQGRLGRAATYFERARRHLEASGSPAHLARLLAEQAEATAMVGLRQDALRAHQGALDRLTACGLALEGARARAGMGRILLELGRSAEAETALAAAASGFGELGHRTARARVDLVRSRLLASQGRLDQARRVAMRALSVLDERPADAAAAHHLLGWLSLQEGDLDRALGDLTIGLALARRLDIAPLLADLLHARGQVHGRAGRRAEARRDLAEAARQVERVRGSLQACRLRAAFLGQRAGIYEDLVAALLDDAGPRGAAAALSTIERCKSRLLLDRLQTARDRSEGPCTTELAIELARARSRLSALYSRLADEEFGATGSGALDAWRAAVQEREREMDELEARAASAGGAEGLYTAPADAEAITAAVGSGRALVEYFALGDEIMAIVVAQGRIEVFRRLTTTRRVGEILEHLEFQINRALRPGALAGARGARLEREAIRELAALHEALLARLIPALPAGAALVIVPHGPLHLVPFAALHDGAAYLVEARQVQIAPSANVWSHRAIPRAAAVAPAGGLVVGVADARAPGVEDEARSVAELVKGARILLGSAATVDRVAAATAGAAVIHLAGHGRFTPEVPLGSGVMLADRPLTARDIHELRLDADLVTLSACETGLSAVDAGDELSGLLSSFLAAGARAVVASLWRVDDATTLESMRRFYQAWDGGRVSVPAALRQAQRDLLARHRHPALWAPFIVVGRS
jgi:CHAT domain-containing protein/tetratricopeptide (TPR) repeat protein